MNDRADVDEIRSAVRAIEPAARLVPRRALRRVIRLTRNGGKYSGAAVHDRCWWVDSDRLFRLLTPSELGLSNNEPSRLLLLPEPADPVGAQTWLDLWRGLFHAHVDRELDNHFANGRISPTTSADVIRELGPANWHAVQQVLEEEGLIDSDVQPETILREFITFASELLHFRPAEWDAFFPGIATGHEPLKSLLPLADSERIFQQTRPGRAALDSASGRAPEHSTQPRPARELTGSERRGVVKCVEHGNDIGAAILLQRAGDPRAVEHLDHLLARMILAVDIPIEESDTWRRALQPLLPGAAARGWPKERRLLYELQRACLAVERPAYAADVVEWAVTFGRRPIKRALPHTKWVEAHRRLAAAGRYAEQIQLRDSSIQIAHLVEHAAAAVGEKARADLRPEIVSVLDEVGLQPTSVAERVSRDQLVEELLDGARTRGFLRIGDLRDAIARNRVKLPDLATVREWLHGDALIRANRLFAVRLDGVYRRGEVYMRALQRGCSLFFGTRPGRFFTRYVALPFGGAFILIEAFRHMLGAGEGLVNWLSGWSATVKAFSGVAGGAAGTLADNPDLGKGGVTWQELLIVGLILFLLIHWPGFRARVIQAAKAVFVRLPRAISQSPVIHALIYNRMTRFFRRYLMTPLISGCLAGSALWLVTGDWSSAGLVGGGVALFVGSFFRTPLGRRFEDRVDEAAARLWRIVSVNFVLGLLTLILQFFRAIFEAIDGAIYAVDEWLRFHEGQSRGAFVFKLFFGAFWFVITYIFRFAWNLLVEPQINPIKHFPVVTVSHKLLLPLIPSLAKQFQLPEETMGTIVFGIPGIFGFLVWELKENWKLYKANASPTIRPAMVGSHGERMSALLRPGFHSGVVPKTFVRLRRAVRTDNRLREAKHRHQLEHVAEGVHRLVERTFIPHLQRSHFWDGLAIHAEFPLLTPNRILLSLRINDRPDHVEIALEERSGWIIASIAHRGCLATLSSLQLAAFASALTGLYKLAGVHAIREQLASAFGPQANQFDAIPDGLVIPMPDGRDQFFNYEERTELIVAGKTVPAESVVFSDSPLEWETWSAWWEADAAGKVPDRPLMPGWTVLPASNGNR